MIRKVPGDIWQLTDPCCCVSLPLLYYLLPPQLLLPQSLLLP
jgi:hypothetical protein